MKIALIVYQDLTLLDLVGFTDALNRLKTMQFLPDLSLHYCSQHDHVTDNFGFPIQVDQIRPDLAPFDLLFIPGGFGTRHLINDSGFIQWIRSAANDALKISVCTGSLILGAAGFLEQRKATTHFDEYELLHQYTTEVIKADIIDDQDVITGGAVGTSIIMGLHLCHKLAGIDAANKIARRMGLPDIYKSADVQVY